MAGTAGAQTWTQDSPGVVGPRRRTTDSGRARGRYYGESARDDLAVGAPRENVGSVPNAVAVTVLFGTISGLTGSGSEG